MTKFYFKTEIKQSNIHGKGRFALEFIPKGETVIEINGNIFKNENGTYINHSINNNIDFLPNQTWVSNKDISIGEEITMDYTQWIKDLKF